MKTEKTIIEFAWLPKKLNDGKWVWLRYYKHTIITEPSPIFQFLSDKYYRKTCMNNMKGE